MTASSGRSAAVYYLDTTTPSTYTTPALTMVRVDGTTDANAKIWRVATSQADKRFLVDTTMTVKVSSVTKTRGTDYTVNGPCIIFKTAPGSAPTIESFSYYVTKAAASASSWSLDIDCDVEQNTCMGDGGWITKVVMMNSASASISQYWADGDVLQSHTTGLFVLALFTNLTNATQRAGTRYECYAYLNSDAVKQAADGVINEDLSFDINGRVYYLYG